MLGYIVHINRYAQHGSQCDEFMSDMAIADRTMVGTPIVHDTVCIDKCPLPRAARGEPGGRPGGVGAFIQNVKS